MRGWLNWVPYLWRALFANAEDDRTFLACEPGWCVRHPKQPERCWKCGDLMP